MQRQRQKRDEHRFAVAASCLLNEQWKLVPRFDESEGGPDFIVHQKDYSFGLEVHEVFKGAASKKKGAALKRKQSKDQLRIDQIRRKYGDVAGNIPLYVKFLNPPDEERIDQIIRKLCKMNLGEKTVSYQDNFTIRQKSGPLKIFVSRLPNDWERDRLSRPDWFVVADAGGSVEMNNEKIYEAVNGKSEKIDQYRKNVAKCLEIENPLDADVRLLLVADHMWNFGKVELDGGWAGKNNGFGTVYFLRFPDSIKKLQ